MGSIEESSNDDKDETFISEEAELVKQIDKDLKESESHIVEWIQEARSCYDFFAGNQWSEDDVQALNEQQRPVIVFNRIARTINAVAGLELQNRQEVRYSPRENTDGKVAEVLSTAAKWVRENCDAEDEESESFQDCLITGMGWTDTNMDYETNLNGSICVDRIDPLCMRWDPNARKRNLDDRRWNAYYKDMDREEFKELWPDFEPEFSSQSPDNMGVPHNATNEDYLNDMGDGFRKKKQIRVVQYQWWEREMVYRVVDKSGKVLGFKDHKFEKIKDYVANEGLTYIKQPRKIYRQAFKNGTQILEQGPCPVDGFSFRCITGLRNRNQNTWFGLISLMKDPQMWANKWLSQILHIINTNTKGGVLAEVDAFQNLRKVQEEWAKPNAIIITNPGALSQGKIQPRVPAPYPDGLDRLLQTAMQNINDIPGVNLEMLGVANRDQAGYLEMQRREAGVTILATFFDSLRRYRKEQGRILCEFIKKYITDGRLVRIVGDEGAKFVPLLKDNFTFEYDIIVDDAPTSPHQKEKVFSVLSSLLPTLLQAGIPIPPDILDYAPIPDALKEKWKSMLSDKTKEEYDQKMKQITLAIAQMEAAKKEKEVSETESKTALNMAKAKEASAVGDDESAQAQNKLGLSHAEQANKNQQVAQDVQRKNAEMIINQKRKELEFNLEQQRLNKEHELKMQHAREEHTSKLNQNARKG